MPIYLISPAHFLKLFVHKSFVRDKLGGTDTYVIHIG
jgi:hypothetical protein